MTDIKVDLWSYLATTQKSIVMYGMGNGADKILAACEKKGIKVCDFFASDGFVRGHLFHGKTVLSYSAIKEKYGADKIIVLLAFASRLPEVIININRIAEECELYAPDVPVSADALFDMEFYNAHKEEIGRVRALLADEKSKLVFDSVIKYKLTGSIKYLSECETDPCETYRDILTARSFEYTADLGAYNGDTARELSKYAPELKEIYAFEPDRRNFRKLSEYAAREDRFSVIPYNIAAWDGVGTLIFGAEGNRNSGVGQVLVNSKTSKHVEVEANSLDNIMRERNVPKIDYIKFDVEGAEKEALKGCYKTIESYFPDMLISVYHKSEDIFSLPLQLVEKFPEYKLYLRKFRYIPAWDLNLYAVKG